MSHTCPGRGCKVELDDTKLTCPAHWRQVPKSLQIDLVIAYKYRNTSPEAKGRYERARDMVVLYLLSTSLLV